MKKKRFYFLYVLFCLVAAPVIMAQRKVPPYTFEKHVSGVLKEFDIIIQMPPEFTVLTRESTSLLVEYFYIRQDNKQFWVYVPVFQSFDKECITLVGIPRRYTEKDREMAKMAYHMNQILHGCDSVGEFKDYSNDRISRGKIGSELMTALQISKEQKDSLFDDYVSVVTGKLPRKMFNADTLFFYDIPLDVPYQGVYPHCLAMISAKKDMASVFFKLFFTDEGKERQDEYFERLNRVIWYKDDKEMRLGLSPDVGECESENRHQTTE